MIYLLVYQDIALFKVVDVFDVSMIFSLQFG